MNITDSCIMYAKDIKPLQALTINVTGIESSILLSCEDSFALKLVTPRIIL